MVGRQGGGRDAAQGDLGLAEPQAPAGIRGPGVEAAGDGCEVAFGEFAQGRWSRVRRPGGRTIRGRSGGAGVGQEIGQTDLAPLVSGQPGRRRRRAGGRWRWLSFLLLP